MKRKITMMLLCCGMLLFAGCGKQKAVEEQPQKAEITALKERIRDYYRVEEDKIIVRD